MGYYQDQQSRGMCKECVEGTAQAGSTSCESDSVPDVEVVVQQNGNCLKNRNSLVRSGRIKTTIGYGGRRDPSTKSSAQNSVHVDGRFENAGSASTQKSCWWFQHVSTSI